MALPRFDVIYHLIGDLKVELGDRMPPVEVEDVVGRLLKNFLLEETTNSCAQGHSYTTVPDLREEGESCCCWVSGESAREHQLVSI